MAARLTSLFHVTSLALAIALVYWWLHVPALEKYSLQLFALTGLAYFLIKGLGHSKAWHILPTYMSIETSLATMAFLLLIGATGNTSSWFYPLTYIHLFFIVFSSQINTSIFITMLIMLFHYGLSPQMLQHELVSILTLPIIMAFFIFAKLQHQEAVEKRLVIQEEEEKIYDLEADGFILENFAQHHLKSQLNEITQLADETHSLGLVLEKVELLKEEVNQVLEKIRTN